MSRKASGYRRKRSANAFLIFLVLLLGSLVLLVYPVKAQDPGPVKSPIIGISFGNSYSYVGITQNHTVTVIPNEYGQRGTPSWVSFTNTGDSLVGEAALNRSTTHPTQTLFGFKRLLGRDYDDVRQFASDLPFNVVDKDGLPVIEVPFDGGLETYSPESITALLLEKLKTTAEAYTEKTITEAVVTVPLEYTDRQRAAIREAGSIAGLDILRIIHDATSAGVAYKINFSEAVERMFLVVDIGGSTTTVSAVMMETGVFETMGTATGLELGGDLLNKELFKYIQSKYNFSGDLKFSQLEREIEQAKRVLSVENITQLIIQGDKNDHQSQTINLTRHELESANSRQWTKVIQLVKEALRDSNHTKYEIDEVVFAGGSARIPKIQQLVTDYFPPTITVQKWIDPEDVIVHGAARQGAILAGEDEFSSMVGMRDDILPLTLGVRTIGGLTKPIIRRGSLLPVKKRNIFTTTVDNQTTILVVVLEGERALAANNRILGAFELHDIAPAPRGVPKIDIQFTVESDGTLYAEAIDLANRHNQSLHVVESRFQTQDIDRRVEEAEMYAEKDEEARKSIESRVRGEDELSPESESVGILEWIEEEHDEL